MPLNSNIILSGQAPDIAGSIQEGLKMRDMMDERKAKQNQIAEDAKVKSAFQNNLIVNPDGSTSLNKKAVLGDLYRVNPLKAQETEKQFKIDDENDRRQKFQTMKDNVEGSHMLAMSSVDAPSYVSNRQKAIELGMAKPEELPEQYDPNFVKTLQMKTLSAAEQFQKMQKDSEFAHQDKTEKQKQGFELEKQRQEEGYKRGASLLTGQQQVDLQKLKDAEAMNRLTETGRQKMKELQAKDAAGGGLDTMKIDKLTKAMKSDLDADQGRAGNFGQISAKVQASQRLQTLVNSYANGDLPPAQMEELSLGMASMLANTSGPARAQVEALVPHTFWGKTQDAAQWLMNEPRGAGQQKFVEQMAHTIEREAKTAQNQLNAIRVARLPAHSVLAKKAPEQYAALLESYGIDPETIKEGKYVAPKEGAPAHPPGTKITVGGVMYELGADGDTLTPVNSSQAAK
jgi:hypothetical protein